MSTPATVIKDIYTKNNNTGSYSNYLIGTDGKNVSLTITSKHSSEGTDSAIAAINSTNRIYYNNVQALMVRKGIQINNLNSNISSYVHKTNDVTGGSVTTSNKVLTQNSTISDSHVSISGSQSAGNIKAIIDGTSATDSSQITSLQAAIPYMVQVQNNTSAIVASYKPSSEETIQIRGTDGLLNIGKKFNALYDTITSYIAEQTTSTNTMTDAELILRYYKQGQSYIIPNSKAISYFGYPSMKDNVLHTGGFMRYSPYVGTISTSMANNYVTTYDTGISSTYKGKIVSFTPNTILRTTKKGRSIIDYAELYDKDLLPVPPDDYKWKCTFIRGTYPFPASLVTSQAYCIWELLDGYHTFGGYTSNNFLSIDINIPNMFKGTSFENFGASVTGTYGNNQNGIVKRYGNQDGDQWRSLTLGDTNSVYDTYSTVTNSSAMKLNNGNLPYKNLMICSTTSRYQYKRIAGKVSKDLLTFNPSAIEAFQPCGNKYNQEDKIRLEACVGLDQNMSYFVNKNNVSSISVARGPAGFSLKNFPVTLYFNKPFMYAEYKLVDIDDPIELDYWWDKLVEISGDSGDEGALPE